MSCGEIVLIIDFIIAAQFKPPKLQAFTTSYTAVGYSNGCSLDERAVSGVSWRLRVCPLGLAEVAAAAAARP